MIRMKDLKRKQMISSVCATCATVFFLCFMMSTDQVSAADQIAKTSSQSITEMTEKKVQETIGSKSLKNELQSEGIITLGDGKQYYYKDGVVAHNYSGYITYSGLWYKILQGRVDTDYTGMGTAETDNWCYFTNGVEDLTYTGLGQNEAGWWYYNSGKIIWNYTGLATNQAGTWYMNNGNLDFDYNSFAYVAGVWYKIAGGKVDTTYTGMGTAKTDNWCFFRNGVEDLTYTGLGQNEAGWWYYNNGKLIWNYTGLATNEAGTWYMNNGNIDFSYNSFVYIAGIWYKISGGKIDTTYTGMGTAETDNWCYFINGVESQTYTGLGHNESGWWYYNNGRIIWNYTGLATNEAGTWYMNNGMIDFSYSNFINYDSVWYKITGGKVDLNYTGIGTAETDNWCYFQNGVESFTYTGMASNEFGWWYYKVGMIDFSYTGFGVNDAGTWFYNNGTIDFQYQGYTKINNTTWYIDGGQVDYKKCIAYDGIKRNISCWGDSMTYGYGTGPGYINLNGGKDISGITFPSELKNLTQGNVNNYSICGETSLQIMNRADSYYKYHIENDILIIEMGSNGGWNNNYNMLIQQYKDIIRNANTSYYIIIGNTDDPGFSNGDRKQTPYNTDGSYVGTNLTNWEKALSEAFGDHFFNTRLYLLKDGLSDCGLVPTQLDVDMIRQGKMPSQLRFDVIHFNSYGYYSKAQGIYKKGQELGYWK